MSHKFADQDPLNDGTCNRNPDDLSFWQLVSEDFATHDRDFFAQGFWALFWHRFGNWRMGVRAWPLRAGLTLVYRSGAKLTQWVCGIDLPYTVIVGRRVKLEHFGGMVLIARQIGDDVIIRQNTTFGLASMDAPMAKPTIGSGVDIGVNVAVLGNVTIGDHCVVGAGAVVLKSQPSNVVVAGVPAKIIKPRNLKAIDPKSA